MVGERMVVTFKPGRVVEEWVASEYHGASSGPAPTDVGNVAQRNVK